MATEGGGAPGGLRPVPWQQGGPQQRAGAGRGQRVEMCDRPTWSRARHAVALAQPGRPSRGAACPALVCSGDGSSVGEGPTCRQTRAGPSRAPGPTGRPPSTAPATAGPGVPAPWEGGGGGHLSLHVGHKRPFPSHVPCWVGEPGELWPDLRNLPRGDPCLLSLPWELQTHRLGGNGSPRSPRDPGGGRVLGLETEL